MSLARSAPWADWRNLDPESAIWFSDSTSGKAAPAAKGGNVILPPGAIRAGDSTTNAAVAGMSVIPNLVMQVDQLDAAAGALTKGACAPKVTLSTKNLTQSVAYARSISIPDYAIAKQPSRLATWTNPGSLTGNGQTGTGNVLSGGARQVALLIEHVLVCTGTITSLTSSGFCVSVKFRGVGAVAASSQTQDCPITANPLNQLPAASTSDILIAAPTYGGASATAFPHMALPSDAAAAGTAAASQTPNAVPSFATALLTNGVCRIWTCVQLPSSVRPGDIAEITGLLTTTVDNVASVAVQLHTARYRFITPPFPFALNRSAQLVNSTVDGFVQLSSQSRVDALLGVPGLGIGTLPSFPPQAP
jgi:hypothetical protein